MEQTADLTIDVNSYTLTAFLLYMLIIVGIGIFSSKFSSKGMANFFLGGRKLNRYVVALSAVVSGRSAWLLLGFTGMAYVRGMSAIWAAAGYIVSEFLLFFFYAPRLRNFTEKRDCITLPDFFAERFNDRTGSLRIILVSVIVLFMVSYVSAQFVGGGKAFASSFGLSNTAGVLITAGIVLFYTVIGGFLAVSLTDMLQAIFMIIALLVLPVVAIVNFGGWELITAELARTDTLFLDPLALSGGALIGFLGIGLGSPGNPHILIRYMSIENSKHLKASAYIGTIWNVLMAVGALFIGIAGRAYFPDSALLPGNDPENLYPLLAENQLHPILFGMIISSIFAAIMSTCDSQLLVAASSIVRDIYQKVIKRGRVVSEKTLMILSRVMVTVLVVAALILGMLAQELVFWLVLFAWAGLGAAIGPVSILALFWKKTSLSAVTAGMLTGTFTVIIWYYIPSLNELMYELVPAFFLSTAVTIIVSLFTKAPENSEAMFKDME